MGSVCVLGKGLSDESASGGPRSAGQATAFAWSDHTLRTIVKKLMECPDDPRYRRLRVANSKLQRTLLSLEGGAEALEALGFTLILRADDEDSSFYVRPVNS